MARRSLVAAAAILVTLLSAPVAASAQAAPIDAATAVVIRQLDAFRRDDYDTAYTFASGMIRAMFDRQGFERMVRGGYPEIAHSTTAAVTGSRIEDDGSVVLVLRIVGATGRAIRALYEMVREGTEWRINGVVTTPLGDAA